MRSVEISSSQKQHKVIGDLTCGRHPSVCFFREDICVIEILRDVSSCSLMEMTEEGKKFVMKSEWMWAWKQLTNRQGPRMCGMVCWRRREKS